MEAVPDPRGAHGLRYDQPFLLTCLVAAVLCSCDSTEAVAQWCHDQVALLRNVFGPRLFLMPSGSLYRWLLLQLDAPAIERVLGTWVQATTTVAADEALALASKASPKRLLELNRGHWSIENRSHYVRDVTFGEDRSRLRTGQAPQILAAFRNLAIILIHRYGSCHIKATRRHFASCPLEALALLSSPKGGQQ